MTHLVVFLLAIRWFFHIHIQIININIVTRKQDTAGWSLNARERIVIHGALIFFLFILFLMDHVIMLLLLLLSWLSFAMATLTGHGSTASIEAFLNGAQFPLDNILSYSALITIIIYGGRIIVAIPRGKGKVQMSILPCSLDDWSVIVG